ncbi:MAG: GGDEF domain-containing protein [Oxalobacter sp.]|nr:GGDEF domain-containing protein [Oxalobacter sp.]
MKTQNDYDLRDQELEALRREVAYLRKNSEQTAGRLLLADTQAIAIRHELEQKRRGFRLMADLAVSLGRETDYESVFVSVSRRINAALSMQRTAVLAPDPDGGFSAVVLQGYPPHEQKVILECRIEIDPEMLDPTHPVLVTGADPDERLASVRKALALPYLISSPVMLHDNVVALLVTGRLVEERPYLPRLGESDVETVQMVSVYLAVMFTGFRLRHAEILASYDPLTQLFNLRSTTESLRHTLEYAQQGGYHAALLFIDLDGFKDVNDTHGHAAGDMVLRIVSERLVNCVRESDIVGRIGGDEFVVVLTHISQPEDAAGIAGKIVDSLSRPMDVQGARCQVGASVGIAVYPEHGEDESALLHAADDAMYAVKNNGKNAYRYAITAKGTEKGS